MRVYARMWKSAKWKREQAKSNVIIIYMHLDRYAI